MAWSLSLLVYPREGAACSTLVEPLALLWVSLDGSSKAAWVRVQPLVFQPLCAAPIGSILGPPFLLTLSRSSGTFLGSGSSWVQVLLRTVQPVELPY